MDWKKVLQVLFRMTLMFFYIAFDVTQEKTQRYTPTQAKDLFEQGSIGITEYSEYK